MNIKTISPTYNNLAIDKSAEASSETKMQSSDKDRDADGKRQNDKQKHPPMTEEEIEKALEFIKNLPGVIGSQLIVKKVVISNQYYLIIENRAGELVRRIPEIDLWELISDHDRKTGQLLDKVS